MRGIFLLPHHKTAVHVSQIHDSIMPVVQAEVVPT